MSIRALIVGLLGCAFIGGAGYINDTVLNLTDIVGNHLPISVFGILILWVIGVNPLLGLIRPGWRFRPGELAVIVAMMLVACSIPGSGLMRTFFPALAMPAEYNRQLPGWKNTHVLSYAPPNLLPAGGKYDPNVHEPLSGGLEGEGAGQRIGLDEVPWAQWHDALTTWIPLIFLLGVGLICLALVVHPQWSKRERLRYPIAEFARALKGDDGAKPIIHQKLFWIGLGVIFVIHVANGLTTWQVINFTIPLDVPLYTIANKWPWLTQIPEYNYLLNAHVYPTVLAFSFFLATDVALSLGISHLLFMAVMGILIHQFGVSITDPGMVGGPQNWQYFGSYLGLGLLVLYTGRRYYRGILKGLVTFKRQDGVENYAIWATRIGIVAGIAVVAILVMRADLAWPFAVMLVGLLVLMFMGMARISAESGLFFIQTNWQPLAIFVGLFGVGALGPRAFVTIALISAVLAIDPRECLMPFVVNGLKIGQDSGVKPARMGWSSGAALAVALAVAVPVVLWATYNYGVKREDEWAAKIVPQMPFESTATAIRGLKDPGPGEMNLDESRSLSTWQRLTSMKPDSKFVWWMLAGLAMVVGLNVMRLRFTWWPLHPILFLVWGTYPLGNFFWSFLFGWIVKSVVTKLGGGKTYNSVKPLMIGIIAGDLLGGLVFMVGGALYYAVQGKNLGAYIIFPT